MLQDGAFNFKKKQAEMGKLQGI